MRLVIIAYRLNILHLNCPEAVFLVMLGTSSFPPRQEVYGKTTEKLVPSWEQARIRHDKKYGLNTQKGLAYTRVYIKGAARLL